MQESLAKNRRWLTIISWLLALLFLLCIWFSIGKIQTDLRDRGEEALRVAGLNPDYLSVKGCDLSLNGQVESDVEKAQYTSAVGNLKGIRQAGLFNPGNGFFNNLNIKEAVVPIPETPEAAVFREPNLDITIKDGKAIVSCLLSDAERLEVLKAAEKLYGTENVVDNCVVATDLKEAAWLDGMLGLLPTFNTDLEGARLTAIDNSLTISGLAVGDEQRASLGKLATAAVGLNLQNNIRIKEAELIEPNFSFIAGDGLELTGNVNQTSADSIQKAIADSSNCKGFANIDDRLQIGENYSSPVWTTKVFNQACTATVDSSNFAMTYADNKLVLTGTVNSEEKRLEIADRFAKASDTIEIVNKLEVVEPIVLKEPSFKWQRNNGKLNISGNVAEPTSIYANSAATCAIDAANIDNQLNTSADYKLLPWTKKVFDEACVTAQESPDFAMDYNNGKLVLAGTVASEALRTEIGNKYISASDGIEVVNNLEVIKAVEIPLPAASSEVENPEPVVPEVTAEVVEPATGPEVAVATAETATVIKLRPPNLRVDISSNRVRLNGNLPTATEQENVALGFNDKEVENKVVVNAEIANPDYLEKVINLGPELAQELDRVTINLENEKLTILGVASSEEQRTAVGDYVQNRLEPDVTVVNKLTVKSTIPFTEDGK